MFSIFDHVYGALAVRIKRLILNSKGLPDVSIIIPNLAIGGVSNIEKLAQSGFNSIIDVRLENSDNLGEIKKLKIDFLRIKIKDRKTPSSNDYSLALDWIKNKLNNNEKVFIHCNLGRGRAPMIACLYLVSQGMKVKDAIQLLKQKRKEIYFNDIQLKFINNFSLQSKK